MIVVTGATGALGSLVVESLLLLADVAQHAVSVHRPREARSFSDRGVDVRQGDYDDPEGLARSFSGADRLLLVSSRGIDHELRRLRHRHAIDAVVRAGVGHVFYTSLLPGEDSVAYVMRAHLDTEAHLEASGLSYTVLKNGVSAESWSNTWGETAR